MMMNTGNVESILLLFIVREICTSRVLLQVAHL